MPVLDTVFQARAEDQTFRMASCKIIWNGYGYEKECTRELSAKTEEIEDLTYKISDLQYELFGESNCNEELQEKLTKAVKENEELQAKLAKAVIDQKDNKRLEKNYLHSWKKYTTNL